MKVCLVGGIFDKPQHYREKHAISPETVLAEGCRSRGLRVTTVGHSAFARLAAHDVIHVHHLGRAALRMALANPGGAFVYTSHDGFLLRDAYAENWKKKVASRLVLKRADAVVALSDREKRFYIERLSVSPQRVHLIPNGVDGRSFRPVEGVSPAPYALLCVGQLQWFKGVDVLIRSLPQVVDRFPGVTLTLVYQTDGLVADYRALAERMGVARHVIFAGRKSPSELAAAYSAAAMLVQPSYVECLSTVVLEAMSCGTPVVATDVGGIREQIDESCGMVVPPGNTEELAAAIRMMLSDPDRRSHLGRNARTRVAERYTVPAMIDGHLDLYGRLTASKRRANA